MRKNSLSKEKDIARVLRGRPFFSKNLTIKANKRTDKESYRYTIIVSKKVMKLAVSRNKFKRRVRSIILSQRGKINNSIDFVVVAKKGVEQVEFSIIKNEVLVGMKKLNIT